ncbi:hypothetical protein [Nocardia cyriacigeorgica]|uniref:hypothetical protein n=1 Tax=Nocardia cyriacigeorgica TaxID=135487 RepID=UPI002456806E|nr:hypothetical protein [Nocardia cyriacigeorgica]
MSRGRVPRTPEHFPRMKWRARKRVDHALMVAAFGDVRCSLRLAAEAWQDPKLAAALDEIAAAARRMVNNQTKEARDGE